jgi:O-antigen/teichoic acid export membrane protein
VEGIIRPALLLMTGRMIGYAVCFLIPLVLVRFLDQEVFGTYKQLFLIYGSLYIIAQLGISESLYYFLPEGNKRSGSYVCNALIMLVLFGSAPLIALWVFGDSIASAMNNDLLSGKLPWIGLFTWLMLISSVLEITLTATKRHAIASSSYAIFDTARAFACIIPVVLFKDLDWLLVMIVVVGFVRFFITIAYLRSHFKSEFRPRLNVLGRQLAYAVPFGLAVFVEVLQAQFHFYFVSYKSDAASFAIYAVACLNIPIVDYLATSASNVLMVRMRELSSNLKELVRVWNDAIRKLSLLVFPLVGLLLVSAEQFIVVLFTEQYQEATPIFMVWMLGLAFAVAPVDGALRVFAETRVLLIINIIRLAFVLTLIPSFYSWFGIVGPVAVTVGASLVHKVLGLIRLRQVIGVPLRSLFPVKEIARLLLIASASMIPPIFMMDRLDASPAVLLLIACALYVSVYLTLLMLIGRLEGDERKEVIAWARSPISIVEKIFKGS